jgi:enolase
MIDLDGTKNKGNLGANAILGGPHAIYRITQMFHLSKGKKVAGGT